MAAAAKAENEANSDVAEEKGQPTAANTTTDNEPREIGILIRTHSGIEVSEDMLQPYGFPCLRCSEVGYGYTECVRSLKKKAEFYVYCGCRGVSFARCACNLGAGILRFVLLRDMLKAAIARGARRVSDEASKETVAYAGNVHQGPGENESFNRHHLPEERQSTNREELLRRHQLYQKFEKSRRRLQDNPRTRQLQI